MAIASVNMSDGGGRKVVKPTLNVNVPRQTMPITPLGGTRSTSIASSGLKKTTIPGGTTTSSSGKPISTTTSTNIRPTTSLTGKPVATSTTTNIKPGVNTTTSSSGKPISTTTNIKPGDKLVSSSSGNQKIVTKITSNKSNDSKELAKTIENKKIVEMKRIEDDRIRKIEAERMIEIRRNEERLASGEGAYKPAVMPRTGCGSIVKPAVMPRTGCGSIVKPAVMPKKEVVKKVATGVLAGGTVAGAAATKKTLVANIPALREQAQKAQQISNELIAKLKKSTQTLDRLNEKWQGSDARKYIDSTKEKLQNLEVIKKVMDLYQKTSEQAARKVEETQQNVAQFVDRMRDGGGGSSSF